MVIGVLIGAGWALGHGVDPHLAMAAATVPVLLPGRLSAVPGGASLFSRELISERHQTVVAHVVTRMPIAERIASGDPVMFELTGGLAAQEFAASDCAGLCVVDGPNAAVRDAGGPGDLAIWAAGDGWLYMDRRVYEALRRGVIGAVAPARAAVVFTALPGFAVNRGGFPRAAWQAHELGPHPHAMLDRLVHIAAPDGSRGSGAIHELDDGTGWVVTARHLISPARRGGHRRFGGVDPGGAEVLVSTRFGAVLGTVLPRPSDGAIAEQMTAAGAASDRDRDARVLLSVARELDIVVIWISSERLADVHLPASSYAAARPRQPVVALGYPDPRLRRSTGDWATHGHYPVISTGAW